MSALHVCYKFYFEPTEITYCFFIPLSLLLLFLPYSFHFFFVSYNLPKNGNTMSLLYLCLNGSLHARTHFGNRKKCSQLKYTSKRIKRLGTRVTHARLQSGTDCSSFSLIQILRGVLCFQTSKIGACREIQSPERGPRLSVMTANSKTEQFGLLLTDLTR